MSSLVKLVPVDRLKYLTKINFVCIDDLVFRLHYRFTFIGLLIVSVLLTGEQLLGKPIQCIKGAGEDVKIEIIQTYCWVEGTFTLPKALMKAIDTEVAAPGVEQFYEKDEVLEHTYYQWVCVVLFLQSLCFYVTRMLWKGWERGKIKHLIDDLNKVILKADKKKEKCDKLVGHLIERRGQHNAYAFRYFICEVLNFFNVIIQMVFNLIDLGSLQYAFNVSSSKIFINWFLGGEFSKYGINVLNYIDKDPNGSEDPMARVFPKLTKCTFRQYGPSGDIKRFDNLCLLPQNILNEKVYIILWFWLYLLVVASGLMVLYRLIIIAFPQSRYFLLHRLHHLVPPKYFDVILAKCSYGDWFLLYLLGKNLDTMHYRDVIIQLSEQLDELPSIKFNDEYDASETTKV
jgi:hypothetical protein